MDDISRMRRNHSNISSVNSISSVGGYNNSNSGYSNYPMYQSDLNERLPVHHSSQYMNESSNSNHIDHTNNYSGRYGSSSSVGNSSQYEYSDSRDRDIINKGNQPRSLRGVLEKDPIQRLNEKESNGM